MNPLAQARRASVLSLFGSASTLLCCALPALFVSLGAGAVLAGLTSAVPQLIWLSRHKVALFVIAAVLLLVAGWLLRRARHAPCPADAALAAACRRQRRVSSVIYSISLALYAVGALFAFILPRLYA